MRVTVKEKVDSILKKNLEYIIEKSTIECYKIRAKYTWADITIDESFESGRIQIASDFGSWQYYWGACGKPFKEFLIGLNDIDYVAGKFGESRWFDIEKTIEYLKRRILEIKPSEEQKKELLSEISELEQHPSCREEFVMKMWECPKLMDMEDNLPQLIETISPAFKMFWGGLWKAFIDELKKESHIS